MDSEGLAQEAVPHTSRSRETWRAYLYIMGQSIIKTELSRKQSNSRYGQASNRWKQWFSLRASRVRSVFPKQMQSRQPENLDVIVFQDSSDYIWAPNSLESPFLLVPFTLRHSYSPNIEDKKNGREKRFFNQISLSLFIRYTRRNSEALVSSCFFSSWYLLLLFAFLLLLLLTGCSALFSTPSSSVVILSRPVRPPPPYISSVRYQREFFFWCASSSSSTRTYCRNRSLGGRRKSRRRGEDDAERKKEEETGCWLWRSLSITPVLSLPLHPTLGVVWGATYIHSLSRTDAGQ